MISFKNLRRFVHAFALFFRTVFMRVHPCSSVVELLFFSSGSPMKDFAQFLFGVGQDCFL